jgi:pimeloyl-ACP methyl ester carboxylesterase
LAVRSRILQVAEIATPLIEAGPQEASEAVLFVHGNPGSSTDWSALVAAAGELGRAVAFDMPGFGKARRPRSFDVAVGSYAHFIEQARSALGIERVHLVVHDFGGPFGLVWGLQNPAAWASVCAINVGVLPGYRWHKMARRWRTPILGELVQLYIPRSAWRAAMARANPKGLPAEFIEKMYDDYDRETRATVLKLYRATPDRSLAGEELGKAIASLRKPALVVWGARDPFIPARYAETQREFFDVRELVVLPESGHWPFQDDPQAVRDALVEFLGKQLTG